MSSLPLTSSWSRRHRSIVDEPQWEHLKAAHFGAEVANLRDITIPDDVIAAIPRHIARKYRVVPVSKQENRLTIALADPSDLDTIDNLTHLLQIEINLQVASEADIENALRRYYAGDDGR